MRKVLLILFFTTNISSVFADNKMNLGIEVYKNKAECGTCHTLQAAESTGDIGPNLDMLKPQIEQIINVVKNGIGVMPPWDGILTQDEIEAVAYYVYHSTNK